MSNTAQVDRRVIALPGRPDEKPDPDGVPSPDELGGSEDDILRQAIEAAEVETEPIAIYRGTKRVLAFTIQTVDMRTYENCRKLSQEKQKAKSYANLPLATDIDRAQSNAMLVYHGTVPEDKKRIWDNRTLWSRFNVLTGWDLVPKLLRAGEMERICERIDLLSGYGENAEAERLEAAKNS
jgi:hypothetical protein